MRLSYFYPMAVVALASPFFISVGGASQPLSTLLPSAGNPDPGIQAGGKLFHEFTYQASGDMPPADAVTVSETTDALGNTGLHFAGNFQDLPGNDASISQLNYTVTPIDPGMAITAAFMNGAPSIFGAGSIGAVESFTENPAQLEILQQTPGDTVTSASANFLPGLANLHVQTQISGDVGPTNFGDIPNISVGSLSAVDQTFAQSPLAPDVPEPAVLQVLAIGSMGLLLRRGKKKIED
jgi:hypothetical protein